MYKAIVVDDEEPAREELIALIGETGKDIDIIGEAFNGITALRLIAEKKPDLVFLDIQMPGLNGIEVAREIMSMENPPLIVFVTAYDEYAIKAFELAATDYILKPAHPRRLKKAFKRIYSLLKEKGESNEKVKNLLSSYSDEKDKLTRIIAQREGKDSRVLIDIEKASHFYAQGRDCFVVVAGEELKVRYSLKEIEARLEQTCFVRCHKSFLVNIKYVKEIVPWFSGTYLIKFNDKKKTEIPVSRKYAKGFKEAVGWN